MLKQNERYPYSSIGHPARKEADGSYYCRAVQARRKDDYILCPDCPLFGGEVSCPADDQSIPECWYYDLDLGDMDEVSAGEAEKRTRHLTDAGLVPEFPYFLTEIEAVRKFGLLEEALQFAALCHKGQIRKGSDLPYICHPIECAMLTAKMTDDVEVMAAAALHDVLEDTSATWEDLRDRFGQRTADLVRSDSENKRPDRPKSETWKVRKEENIRNIRSGPREAKIIMLSDKLSNMRASLREYREIGDGLWDRFNMKDPKMHAWYYRSILTALSDLSDLPQYLELARLIDEVFPKGK